MPQPDPRFVLVCPWWELAEPITFGGATFAPLPTAVERFPEIADSLRLGTSSFCSSYTVPRSDADVDAAFLGEVVPQRPVRVTPTVAVVVDARGLDDVRAAVDMIAFAAMCRNNGDVAYCNGPVFESRTFRCGGASGFVVEETRRMTGRAVNAYAASMRIETRPRECGQYCRPDDELLAALEKALLHPNRDLFVNAFAALRTATRDDEYVQPDVERSFYALVVMHLLRDIATSDRLSEHEQVLRRTLDAKVPGGAADIVAAYRAMKLNRNETWHPGSRTDPPHPFERQDLVPMSFVFFRVTEAIALARLVDLGLLGASSKHAAKIAAIDAWIGDLGSYADVVHAYPQTPAEMLAQKDEYERAFSINKRWLEVRHNRAIDGYLTTLGAK